MQYMRKETKIIKEILKTDGSEVPAPSFLVTNLKTKVHTAYTKEKVWSCHAYEYSSKL